MTHYAETTERVIDGKTGELLKDEITYTMVKSAPDEPPYIKMYIEDLSRLCRLTAGENKILLQVAALANYDGVIALPAGIKEVIASNINSKPKVINNALTSLCKQNVLKKSGVGVYTLNPDLFARGKWRDIREQRKAFQSITTYTPDGLKKTETRIIEEQTPAAQAANDDAKKEKVKQI